MSLSRGSMQFAFIASDKASAVTRLSGIDPSSALPLPVAPCINYRVINDSYRSTFPLPSAPISRGTPPPPPGRRARRKKTWGKRERGLRRVDLSGNNAGAILRDARLGSRYVARAFLKAIYPRGVPGHAACARDARETPDSRRRYLRERKDDGSSLDPRVHLPRLPPPLSPRQVRLSARSERLHFRAPLGNAATTRNRARVTAGPRPSFSASNRAHLSPRLASERRGRRDGESLPSRRARARGDFSPRPVGAPAGRGRRRFSELTSVRRGAALRKGAVVVVVDRSVGYVGLRMTVRRRRERQLQLSYLS